MISTEAKTIPVDTRFTVGTASVIPDRPRILHLINNFEVGGTERQAVELLKRIDRNRFDIHLAALSKLGPLYSEIASYFPEICEFPVRGFYNLNALRQLLRLRDLLIQEGIRILHAHDFYAGMIGSIAAKIAGVKVIACQRHLRLSNRRAHLWGTNLINRLADHVLVNSNPIRDHIIASTSSCAPKIVVIENGLELPDKADESSLALSRSRRKDALCRELGLPSTTKLVGILARLQPVKGHRLFIEAASLLARHDRPVHFILIGDGPLRSEIQAQAVNLGIDDRVHFLGERTDGRLLISSVDLAVMSSLHEGLPNALMEAMAAGVPVVATAVGGITELVSHRETGYLVPPGDARALAHQMMVALRDSETSSAIALQGKSKMIERFGMRRMIDSVQSLYDDILTENPKARVAGTN